MYKVQNIKYVFILPILVIFSFISCNREENILKNTKSLRDNIFVKNAKGQLFSFDINYKNNGNRLISYVNRNEVITLGKSSFVDKTKPFFYNFNDVDNLIKYINEGKIWFIPNKSDYKPTKISMPNSIELRKTRKSAYTSCECELAGTGSGNNDCEYEDQEIGPMCWSNGCIECDFIVCPDPVSRCLHETHGGGVFILTDSVVLANSNTKYVLKFRSCKEFKNCYTLGHLNNNLIL